jgi:hypothetical protein
MNFSFLICTHDPNSERIESSIATINDLQIPKYEIIVVGGIRKEKNIPNTNFIDFNEEVVGWLTRKKNIAAQAAQYENLCILHDYFAFDHGWYDGWNKKNQETPNWDIGSNAIKLLNGARDWSDWISWDHPKYRKGRGIPYEDQAHTMFQFIAGHYFLVKREFFLKNPLNENLIQAQEEDVEWSLRVRNKAKIIFNSDSIVRHLKIHRHFYLWRKRIVSN